MCRGFSDLADFIRILFQPIANILKIKYNELPRFLYLVELFEKA